MRGLIHVVVFSLAISLAFSAMYILSERDQFTDTLYGSSYHIIIPPNSNVTIPLGQVSESVETGGFTVSLGSWSPCLSWNQSSSIKHLGAYNVGADLFVSVAVNKSAFIFLEDVFYENRTVDVKAFQSTNFPVQDSGSTEGQTLRSNMELNHVYQLKIGNYETFISNQTGPLRFTIENTNRTLDIMIGALSFTTDCFSQPNHQYVITFTRQPNFYLVLGIMLVDLSLTVVYLLHAIRKVSAR